jgi:hypothetical protein
VLEVPTDRPLQEQQAWASFRDVVLGLEYRKCISNQHSRILSPARIMFKTENMIFMNI